MIRAASGVRRATDGATDTASTATYDWHGVVGIKVLDWKRSDIRNVETQLGLERAQLDRLPDLTIRYVDRLPLPGELTYLSDGAAFAGDAFVLTAGADRRPVMQVPFGSLGSKCDIMLVRGLSSIPLLVPILNLTALRTGYLPVNAAAFEYDGVGVLVAGGARGGKTGTLLAFMSQGATFVGDDWVLVHRDGRAMYGLPTPMQVNDADLRALPEYRARLDVRTKRRIRMMSSLLRLERCLPAHSSRTSIVARARARVRARLVAGLKAQVSPHLLFGAAARFGAGAPDIVFLARSVESPRISVSPIRPTDLVRRLVPLLEYEWRELDRYYTLFRAAFPGRRNEFIESKTEHLEAGLQFALKEKRTYEVSYPSAVPISDVLRTLEPFICGDGIVSEPRVQGVVAE
jgi:hypothetical protein